VARKRSASKAAHGAPVRLAQVVTELDPGGAERIVYELATRLDPARFDCLVVSLAPATGDVADWLREREVPVRSIGMTSKLDLTARHRLAKIFLEEEVGLLHTHLVHANYLGRRAAKVALVPAVVSTVHVVEHRFRPWHYWSDSLTSHLVDVEVCVSEGVKRHTQVRTWVPHEKLRVIYNGVDVARFRKADDPARRSKGRELLGIGEDERVLVSVGRLRPQKGQDVLVQAMADVARAEPRARLVLVGDGPEKRRLERLVRRLGLGERVTLAGQRRDVVRALSAADLFASASRYEGLPLAVMEAMAAAKPVVATRVDSLPELIADGESGLLVPPEEPGRLAGACLEVLKGPGLARRLGAAARRRIEEGFTLEAMISAHESLYEEVLRAKGLGP
jgi:glycosyltransferase involved in cell wall biosynthesis